MKKRTKHQNDLGNDPVLPLVLRLAIPSMIGQFVNVLYSVVDRMYIGHIPLIGDQALAGVGVTGPIVTLISSFAFWVGIGGAPLMSIRMGEKRHHQAEQVLANSFVMILVMAVILMGISYLFKTPLLLAFGASVETLPYADSYMSAVLTGTVFSLIANGLNQFIIAQGFANAGMKSVIIGAVSNIILDPIFIYLLDLGVAGAAWATVLSQLFSACYVLRILFGRQLPVRITFRGYSLRTMLIILKIGLAPFLILAFDNILIITLNTVLQQAGGERGDMLVASFTIVQSFMMLITTPLGGITGGTQAILGYNYGARQVDRIREAQRWIIRVAVIFCTVMFVLAQIVPQVFVALFSNSPQTMEFCTWAIRVYTLGIIPLAVQYAVVDGFTGMGIVRMSLPLSFLRKLNFFICVFAFAALGGAEAIFYAEPVIDVLAGICSGIIYFTVYQSILRKRELSSPAAEKAG